MSLGKRAAPRQATRERRVQTERGTIWLDLQVTVGFEAWGMQDKVDAVLDRALDDLTKIFRADAIVRTLSE